MNRRLPPLNSLRAFEAAARHLSFTKAGVELNVTAAAISQQIKLLEEYFDIVLFKRLTRALILTEPAQMALPLLKDGFDKLAQADAVLREQQTDNVLIVSVAPAFGAKWLIPRLDDFKVFAPAYEVRIDATDNNVDFNKENVDIALRYGLGNYPDLVCECLFIESMTPVCSPQLLAGEHPLKTPEDLRYHTLLHSSTRGDNSDYSTSWQMWLKAAKLKDIEVHRGPRFNLMSMAIQAAIEGQGVALADGEFLAKDIARGNLVQPFNKKYSPKTKFCYFLVYPHAKLMNPKVIAFREWLFKVLQK